MKDSGNAVNLIGKGTEIEGTLRTDSSIVVHGKIKGDIICKNTITIGSDGYIEGNVEAQNAIVGGTVSGTLKVSGKIVLESNSALHGELKTSKLVIDEGAIFDGKSLMDNSGSKNKKIEKEIPDISAEPEII